MHGEQDFRGLDQTPALAGRNRVGRRHRCPEFHLDENEKMAISCDNVYFSSYRTQSLPKDGKTSCFQQLRYCHLRPATGLFCP